MESTSALRTALAAQLDAVPSDRLTGSVQRLITAYRSGAPAEAPFLGSETDATAYAAYRTPVTYAAVRAAVGELRRLAPV